MTAITIDKDKAIELLEKQVEKKGADYVYTDEFNSCAYFADGYTAYKRVDSFAPQVYPEPGAPLCVVGHVYADLGLTINDLYKKGHDGFFPNQNGDLADVFPDPEKVVLTEEARAALWDAQAAQDQGETWGAALAAAKEAVA